MPFRNGDPMEMNLWVLFYLVFCIFLGIFQLLMGFKKDKDKQAGEHHKGSSEQQAYSGRHYQRRQAKNLFRK